MWTDKRQIAKTYERIREQYMGQPMGDHWECLGTYLGDGVWADPEFFQIPGEMEVFGTHRRRAKRTQGVVV